MSENIRNKRKNLTGTVSAQSGHKTVKVVIEYKIPHPKYKKEIKRKTTLNVHDESNSCKLGDKVMIMETRPLSKTKRFRITNIINQASL